MGSGASGASSGTSALLTAARIGDAEGVQILLARGAARDARDAEGRTALHFASTKQTARALLRALADVNAPDFHGLRPLHQAVLNKYPEVMLELLKANADVDARSISAKHIEVQLERPSLQQVWGLRWRSDFLGRQRRILERVMEETPLSRWNEQQMALGAEILRAGAELLEAEGQAGSGAQQVLRNARKLRLVFRQGDPLIGDSPVHLAVRRGDASLLAQLLVARGDPDALGAKGETAFELAAGQAELLEVLATCSVSSTDQEAKLRATRSTTRLTQSFVPEVLRDLHLAARQGDARAVEQLINALADVDGRRGTRSLQLELLRKPGEELWGFEWRDHPTRQILEKIDDSKESPAQRWNQENSSMGGEILRRGDELVEVNGRRGWHEISQLRRWHQVTLIFELVIDETPLAIAAEHGHVEVVQRLLAARADPHLHVQGKQLLMEIQRPSLTASWGFVWDQRFDALRRVLSAMNENSPAASWNQHMLETGEDVLCVGDELIMINERDTRSSFFALRELLDICLLFQRVRRPLPPPLERAAVAGHVAVCDALLTAGVNAKPRVMNLSPLEIFAKKGQVVIELKNDRELVMAFLVSMEDSWTMVREMVQSRLSVSRASFFSQGKELTETKVEDLVVEDHVLTFNLVFRDRLVGSLKTGDLDKGPVELMTSDCCVVSGTPKMAPG